MEDPVYRALRTAAACLMRLERDHAQVRANMAAGLKVGATTTTGGYGDPAGNVTWTGVEADGNTRIALGVGRYQTLIEHALANLLEADLMRGLNVTANTAPLAAKERCTGGAGEWADPSCERLAVVHRWVDGVHHGLCYGCDKARQRAGGIEERNR
jgi:hypothetical protein